MKKINNINIILLYKFIRNLINKHYYKRKNKNLIDFYIIYNSNKQLIYIIFYYFIIIYNI